MVWENPGMSGLDYIGLNLAEGADSIIFLITTIVLGAMVVQAVYFLGAILWPKLSFIKTWAVTQALQILGAIVFVMCTRFDLPNIKNVDISFGGFMCLYITVGLIICGAIYWLAYLRYRRCQVIYKLF